MSGFTKVIRRAAHIVLINTGIWTCLVNKYYKFLRNRILHDAVENPVRAVKTAYFMMLHRFPNLKEPRTINEKLQVLKVGKYYNNSAVTKCADKYLVKEYLRERGYADLCARVYGVYNTPEEIEWDILPQSFVIKCNHGCNYNIICSNKSDLDVRDTKKKLHSWMNDDYWKNSAEFQYRFIDKKILIEEYLGDNLQSYKFICFHGEPRVVYTLTENVEGCREYLDYFDINWNHLDVRLNPHEHYPGRIEKPKLLEKMLEISRKLSRPFPFVRVDLYCTGGKIYFGELTFMPTGGYMELLPKGTDLAWGEWLKL